jgi:hypothetical protein
LTFRVYDPEADRAAAHRIWIETGWLEDADRHREAMDLFVAASRAWVADLEGDPECLVLAMPGTVRHLDAELPMSCIAGVTTSRVARKRGLAGRLTAHAVAADAADGAAVSALGMFEQGYYDRLGFGSGGYEVRITFDPAALTVPAATRTPVRLGLDDWEAVHASRLARRRGHGACNIEPPGITRAEMQWAKNGFGLGYRDGPGGELTHHLWAAVKGDVEYGPYSVWWMSYRTHDQLVELLGVLRNLGDQVTAVRMLNPPGLVVQDLIEQPFRRMRVSDSSDFKSHAEAMAYWQMRICDLPRCLAATRLPGGPVRFNLDLRDPVESFLDESAPWRGIGGWYVVTLGESSGAEPGADPALPTMETTVGAFTRLWLGVCPASGLAVTADLKAPPDLLQALDELMRLPSPHPDWDF